VRHAAALGLVVVPLATVIAAGRAGEQAPPREALPAAVFQVEISFDVETGQAGETAGLRARLRDAAGRAVDAPLRIESDGGTVGEPVRIGKGSYTARVDLPAVLGGRQSLLVTASAGQGWASATLPLAPGPVASLRVQPPTALAADGGDYPLWIGVFDAHGNPSAEAPRAEVRRGSVGEPAGLAPGWWMIRYRPPRDARRGEDVLQVAAGPATASTTLQLAPMVPVIWIGARGGVVLGTDGPAPAVGGEASSWLELGPLDMGLVLGATWWSAESHRLVRASGRDLDLRSRRAWLPVTLSAASRHALGARVVATLSAGGGGALVTSRTTLADQPAVSEAGWAPIASAGVELALPMRTGEPFAAVQGAWIGDPHLDTLRGATRSISLFAGYRFHAP
jgi:hypothetical protein